MLLVLYPKWILSLVSIRHDFKRYTIRIVFRSEGDASLERCVASLQRSTHCLPHLRCDDPRQAIQEDDAAQEEDVRIILPSSSGILYVYAGGLQRQQQRMTFTRLVSRPSIRRNVACEDATLRHVIPITISIDTIGERGKE